MLKWLLLILAALYTINPYDIVPDFLIGYGWVDDLIIWIILWRYLASREKRNADYTYFYKQGGARFDNSKHHYHKDQKRGGAAGQNLKSSTSFDPYRTLGIDRSATEAEIKHAYRELARKYHPDKLEHLGDEFKALAEIRFKEIQKAYQELSGK